MMTKEQLAEIKARHAEQGEHGIDAQTMWDDLGLALAEIERLQISAMAHEEHCAALERMTQDYMRRYGVL